MAEPRAPDPGRLDAAGAGPGPEAFEPLRFAWATLNCPAGKRLAPVPPGIAKALERAGELAVDSEVASDLPA